MHERVRALRADIDDARGASFVMCVRCAAFWVAGTIGWNDRGSMATNVAPPNGGYVPGSRLVLLSDVTQFSSAIRIADNDAGL
jgi:hypothetical protein